MDLRDQRNLYWLFEGELHDYQIPDDEKVKLKGMSRVKTYKPFARKYGILPAIVLFSFSGFILAMARVWIGIPIALIVCVIFYVVLYFNSPTHCPECKKEMDYFRPYATGIKYDWCKKCKKYSNVRWIPEEKGGGSM